MVSRNKTSTFYVHLKNKYSSYRLKSLFLALKYILSKSTEATSLFVECTGVCSPRWHQSKQLINVIAY